MKMNIPYINYGVLADGAGEGGFGRRKRANLPKGVKLEFAIRRVNGERVIKTLEQSPRYFTLTREV